MRFVFRKSRKRQSVAGAFMPAYFQVTGVSLPDIYDLLNSGHKAKSMKSRNRHFGTFDSAARLKERS